MALVLWDKWTLKKISSPAGNERGIIEANQLATHCSGRRVFYSITTGRTTEIAEVSRRQPLEYWKIGPKVLTIGKLRPEQLMLLESMILVV